MSGRIGLNIVNNGLVLYLDAANTKSYVSGSTAWNDLSRSENNGTLLNGPIYDSSNGGNILFDGVDDYCLNIFTFPKTNNISINIWGKFNAFPLNSGLFQVQNTGTTPSTGFAQKILAGWNNTSGQIYGRIVDSTETFYNLPQVESATVLLNTWYYFSYIADGSNYNLYINGNYKTQVAYNGIISDYDRIFIATQGDQAANVNLTNFSIYNRALSAAEILQNYNATKSKYGL